MKKSIYLFFCIISILEVALAQAVQTKEPNYRDPVLDRQFGIIGEVKAKKEATQGSYYISENWNTGTIYLKSGDTLKGYPLKYDIDKNLIEIKTPQQIKALSGNNVIAFEWDDTQRKSFFLNGEQYTFEGTKLYGFYQILTPGKVELLSKIFLEIKRADYNVALDVGSRADKIIQREKLFVAKDKQLFELKSREIPKPLSDKALEIKVYLKQNNLKLNKKDDAIRLVNYYNSI
jgi:hypothetical protein